MVNNMTGLDDKQIYLNTNPTLTYAELVLQPQTLSYGLYRIVFKATQIISNSTEKLSNSIDTFIEIVPSGLVVSSLKLSKPMYGGTIEITRGSNQSIQFDPYLFTYDIDRTAVITSLKFEYSCQIVNQVINATVRYDSLDTCFNETNDGLENFIFLFCYFYWFKLNHFRNSIYNFLSKILLELKCSTRYTLTKILKPGPFILI